jgi:hypothetical protein
MKKATQVVPLCKELEQVTRRGPLRRSLMPQKLLLARTHLHMQNMPQVAQTLSTLDDSSMERDFLLAVCHYHAQDYKQYYLICLGLVAGAK